MLISEPLSDEYEARAAEGARNFQIFDYLCNGVRAESEKEEEIEKTKKKRVTKLA